MTHPIEANRAGPPVNPRPGVVKALGIINIATSVMLMGCLLGSAWMAAAGGLIKKQMDSAPKVEITLNPQPIPKGAIMAHIDPLMGIDDRNFVLFAYVDAFTGLAFNALMFATGIGLVNLRRWAARWWTWLAWAKIVRLVVLWGGVFVLGVIPSYSESVTRSMLASLKAQNVPPGRMPQAAFLTQTFSVALLIAAAAVILLGAIYPAASLWVLGRPDVRAALISPPSPEGPDPS